MLIPIGLNFIYASDKQAAFITFIVPSLSFVSCSRKSGSPTFCLYNSEPDRVFSRDSPGGNRAVIQTGWRESRTMTPYHCITNRLSFAYRNTLTPTRSLTPSLILQLLIVSVQFFPPEMQATLLLVIFRSNPYLIFEH